MCASLSNSLSKSRASPPNDASPVGKYFTAGSLFRPMQPLRTDIKNVNFLLRAPNDDSN